MRDMWFHRYIYIEKLSNSYSKNPIILSIPLIGYQNNLRVLYCQSKPTGPKAKSTRHIPQAPDRILDAPDIVDDYCEY